MKILIISNMYPSEKDPVYGTFVESFFNAVNYRNKKGTTKLVAIKGRTGNKLSKIWKYIKFNSSVIYYTLCHRFDIVYVHCLTYSAIPVRLISALKNLKVVINVHGGDVLTQSGIANKLKKFNTPLLYKARLIVSPSFFFKNVLINEFPSIREERIFISPSGGVNTKDFHPVTKYCETFTIGYVGRIDKGKGWNVLLEAASNLINLGLKNFKLIIAGRGSLNDELQKLIIKLGLSNIVDYVGPIPHDGLPEIYRQFDVFVFPTMLEESLGLVAIEAMACGIPVIGSKIGGLNDYISHGRNGYFFNPGDSNDLAQKLFEFHNLSYEEKIIMKNYSRITAEKYDSDFINNELFKKLEFISH